MKHITLIILSLLFLNAKSQNRVVNGSLESFTSCPNYINTSTINNANGWWTAKGTCDLFNNCSIDPNLHVPRNIFDWQKPRTGATYGGAYLFTASLIYPDGHQNVGIEAFGVSLSQTLTAAKCRGPV